MFRRFLPLLAVVFCWLPSVAQASPCDPPVPALRPGVCIPRTLTLTLRPTPASGAQGVDVSDFQRAVRWSQAIRAGLRWAYVQFGDGLGFRDSVFSPYWTELRGLGIPHGGYLFLRPGNGSAQGRDLALAIRSRLGEHTLPPAIDAEVPGAYQQVCPAVRAIRAVLRWQLVMVYTAPGLWPFGQAACTGVLWVADYDVLAPALAFGFPSYAAWQWGEGSFAGIGSVDRDVAHGILTLTYGRTVLLPDVERQRRTLRAARKLQHCPRALRHPGASRRQCRAELAQGSRLTRRARQLERS